MISFLFKVLSVMALKFAKNVFEKPGLKLQGWLLMYPPHHEVTGAFKVHVLLYVITKSIVNWTQFWPSHKEKNFLIQMQIKFAFRTICHIFSCSPWKIFRKLWQLCYPVTSILTLCHPIKCSSWCINWKRKK